MALEGGGCFIVGTPGVAQGFWGQGGFSDPPGHGRARALQGPSSRCLPMCLAQAQDGLLVRGPRCPVRLVQCARCLSPRQLLPAHGPPAPTQHPTVIVPAPPPPSHHVTVVTMGPSSVINTISTSRQNLDTIVQVRAERKGALASFREVGKWAARWAWDRPWQMPQE